MRAEPSVTKQVELDQGPRVEWKGPEVLGCLHHFADYIGLCNSILHYSPERATDHLLHARFGLAVLRGLLS